jgi:hypothetical protein
MPGVKADSGSGPAEELLIAPGYRMPNESWTMARDEFSLSIALRICARRRFAPIISEWTKSAPSWLSRTSLAKGLRFELALSSDSRWLLFSRLDRSGSSVMVANIR